MILYKSIMFLSRVTQMYIIIKTTLLSVRKHKNYTSLQKHKNYGSFPKQA